MKAEELRIGNIVHYQFSETSPILENVIDGDDIKLMQEDSSFLDMHSGIPLTEEWLLRCGFERKKYTYRDGSSRDDLFWLENYSFGFDKLSKGDVLKWLSRIHFGEIQWLANLDYIHQLQNLYYALKGEELTFKTK